MVKLFVHGLPFAVAYSIMFMRSLGAFYYTLAAQIPFPNIFWNPPALVLTLIFLVLGTTALNAPLSNLLWKEYIPEKLSTDLIHGIALSCLLVLVHNVIFVFIPYLPPIQTIAAIPVYAILDGYLAREVAFLTSSARQKPFAEKPKAVDEGLQLVGRVATDRGRCPYCGHMNEFAREDISMDGTANCAMCHKSYFVLTKDVLLRELGEDPTRIDL
jgi:hypothetical protein